MKLLPISRNGFIRPVVMGHFDASMDEQLKAAFRPSSGRDYFGMDLTPSLLGSLNFSNLMRKRRWGFPVTPSEKATQAQILAHLYAPFSSLLRNFEHQGAVITGGAINIYSEYIKAGRIQFKKTNKLHVDTPLVDSFKALDTDRHVLLRAFYVTERPPIILDLSRTMAVRHALKSTEKNQRYLSSGLLKACEKKDLVVQMPPHSLMLLGETSPHIARSMLADTDRVLSSCYAKLELPVGWKRSWRPLMAVPRGVA